MKCVKATLASGAPIYINLDKVRAVMRIEANGYHAKIMFDGDSWSVIVNETPEEFLKLPSYMVPGDE